MTGKTRAVLDLVGVDPDFGRKAHEQSEVAILTLEGDRC